MNAHFAAGLLAVTSLALPAAAFAHAGITPKAAENGQTIKAVITVPHGCDGAATTDVIVKLPEGFVGAKPQAKAGWQVEITKGDYAKTYKLHGKDVSSGAREVHWSGGNLPDDQFDEFVIQGSVQGFDAAASLPFVTTQLCGTTGTVTWDEIPAEGQDAHSLEHPAPAIAVSAASAADAHAGHGMAMGPITLGDLEISGPFTRATLPGAKVGGGFLTILNKGETADRLVSASSPAAKDVQLHEMKMEGEVMQMRQLENGIEIPAGSTVTLQPGGLHIMFMGLNGAFVQGQTVPVTLTFEKAGTVEVTLAVEAVGADAPADHGAMQHSDASAGGHDAHAGASFDQASAANDQEAIAGLLKATFESAEHPLGVAPIVVAGDYAIAGWSQDGKGGRALLRKTAAGWGVHLCSGDALKDAANLETIGVPADAAKTLAASLAAEEARLDPALVAQFSLFDGTVIVDENLI